MKDELKKYVEQHRERFESYDLDVDDAWQEIELELERDQQSNSLLTWRNVARIAAVFVVIAAIGFGFYLNNERIKLNDGGIALHRISADLADTEAFYSTQIDEKLQMIEAASGSLDEEVVMQLKVLDEDYSSLKKDLNDQADSEEVINAMIQYYRLKLSMLEKILDEIQEKDENENHDTVQAI